MNCKKGISLITLIMTIVIIIILAGIVILSLINTDIFNKADESAFKQSVGEYKSELALFLSEKVIKDPMNYDKEKEDYPTWISGPIEGTIKDVILSMKEEHVPKFEIRDGELVYIGDKEDESEWSEDMGIDTIIPKIEESLIKTKINPTEFTNKDVEVIIEFPKEAGIREYSINGEEFLPYTSPFKVEKNCNINIVAKTNALGEETIKSLTIDKIDKLLPESLVYSPDGSENTKQVNVKIESKDSKATSDYAESGIKEIKYIWNDIDLLISENSDLWNDAQVVINKESILKKDTTEIVYLHTRVEDKAGNKKSFVSKEYNIDNTAPDVTNLMILLSTGNNWTNTNPTVTINGFTEDSKIKEYSIDGKTWNAYTAPFTITANGTITARAIDNAGNESVKSYVVDKIDKTAPAKTTVNLNGYTSGSWTNQNVTQTFNSSDTQSGINEYETNQGGTPYTISNPYVISSDGQWEFQVRAVDKAGNVGQWSDTYTIQRDRITPTVLFTPNTASNVKSVTVNVNASDNASLVKTIKYQWKTTNTLLSTTDTSWNSAQTVVNKGNLTRSGITSTEYLQLLIEDNAGNKVVKVSGAYNIDNTAPDVTNLMISLSTGNNWTNTNPTVTINGFTEDSKIKEYSIDGKTWNAYTAPFTITANGTITARAIDNAGNESVKSYVVDKIDKTAPVISSVTGNPTSWSINSTLMIKANDGLGCGMNDSSYSFDNGSTWNSGNSKMFTSNQNVFIKVRDKVGNIQTTNVNITKISVTVPTLTVTNTSKGSNTVTLRANATDHEMGIQKIEFSKDNVNFVNNGTNNTYVFTGLNGNTGYTFYVKITSNNGKTALNSINVTTNQQYASYDKYACVQPNCTICSGNGKITSRTHCYDCSGSGMITLESPCTKCNGTGSTSEYQLCGNCMGAGTLVQSCSGCGGKGYNYCTYCRFGATYCYVCNNTKKTNCYSCYGSGNIFVTCWKCKGTRGGMVTSPCIKSIYTKTNCYNGTDGKKETTTTCTTCSGSGKQSYQRGNYVGVVSLVNGSVPNNSRHSDGYWYIYKSLIIN